MSEIHREVVFSAGQRLQLVQGDLTQEQVEAIVNAANAGLQHGGGVAGAIVRRGGPSIQQESDEWVRQHGPVSHGEPAYTRAGNLPCKYVIHAVGPVWGTGEEDAYLAAKLAAAVTGSLRLAARLELDSIALPAISTGVFGFPKERAARVILGAIRSYYRENPDAHPQLVRLTILDGATLEAFRREWGSLSG